MKHFGTTILSKIYYRECFFGVPIYRFGFMQPGMRCMTLMTEIFSDSNDFPFVKRNEIYLCYYNAYIGLNSLLLKSIFGHFRVK